MFPLIFLGVAAVALFSSGCSRNSSEKKETPRDPIPPQAPSPQGPSPAQSSAPVGVPNPPSIAAPPEADEAPPQSGARRKLSPKELQDLGEKLRKCLQVQRRYGLSCPPPSELPPGCTCEEVILPRELDPNTPSRLRQRMLPPSNKPSDSLKI